MSPRQELDFDRLVPIHYKRVYGTLLRVTGNPEDAKDLTQETFLKAFIRRATFRGDSDPGTWLIAIALNAATDFFRRRKEIPTGEMNGAQTGDCETEATNRLTVNELLSKLSPLDRLIMMRFYLQDAPQERIALDLGISTAAVKMRLARAKERFARLYGNRE